MDTRTKGKVGAPYGNWNRLVHGNRSPRIRAVRAAERRAAWEEERKKFEEWSAPRLEACRAQHARILAELEAERAERAKTESELWPPIA